MRLALLAALFAAPAHAQEADITRALIQRDRQSAEFSRPELRELHQRQELRQTPLRPDERVMQAREREAFLIEEAPVPGTRYRALPLPGGPRHLVDPIPVQGGGG